MKSEDRTAKMKRVNLKGGNRYLTMRHVPVRLADRTRVAQVQLKLLKKQNKTFEETIIEAWEKGLEVMIREHGLIVDPPRAAAR